MVVDFRGAQGWAQDSADQQQLEVGAHLAENTDAVILVGGKGTRLRPLTNSVPKPMMPTAGVPFLQHLLGRIKAAGMTHVVLGTSFKAEVWCGLKARTGIFVALAGLDSHTKGHQS